MPKLSENEQKRRLAYWRRNRERIRLQHREYMQKRRLEALEALDVASECESHIRIHYFQFMFMSPEHIIRYWSRLVIKKECYRLN